MKHKRNVVSTKPIVSKGRGGLRHRAETRLRQRHNGHGNGRGSKVGDAKLEASPQRLLHELQVHQVELEMQNMELQEARDRMEILLEKYTDLYDFAPVGYFSIDASGLILEANLTGAALLGIERSRLTGRSLARFMVPASRVEFQAFLQRILAGAGKQACEAALVRENGKSFWASFHGASAVSPCPPGRFCRLAVSDITTLKQAEEAQRRLQTLAVANRELVREITRREAVEQALKQSEQHYGVLLEQSNQMQEQLRRLSRQLLVAQEEERKIISRELHDVIAQTLTSINVRLANLKAEATKNSKGLDRSIARTQRLVEQAVDIVHRFARELRPTVLDDLGLIPALHTFMKSFREATGIHVSLSVFAAIEQVNGDKRTVLYRVTQEALTNIARHARASQVRVKLAQLNGAVCLKVIDNGKGFQAARLSNDIKNRRLGLLGMRERLEMVGGKFSVTSAPGKGTTVRAEIPLADARAARAGEGGRNSRPKPRGTKS
jgi:PAS domain S-box-containing protein